jgi:lipid II:glycine glycyltransferase (peptidoglycan interpeptide bridge formation enzyme)
MQRMHKSKHLKIIELNSIRKPVRKLRKQQVMNYRVKSLKSLIKSLIRKLKRKPLR